MPGTRLPKHSGIVSALVVAALLALPGCYARRPIPLDAPAARPQAPAQAPEAAPAKAEPEKPAEAAPAPAQAAPEQATPAEAAPQPPAIQEKDLTDAPAAQTAPAAKTASQSYVQIGAFGTAMNALGAVAWLKEKGFETSRMVRVEQGQGTLFKVQAGPFQDLVAAHKALEVLKPDWPQAFIPVD